MSSTMLNPWAANASDTYFNGAGGRVAGNTASGQEYTGDNPGGYPIQLLTGQSQQTGGNQSPIQLVPLPFPNVNWNTSNVQPDTSFQNIDQNVLAQYQQMSPQETQALSLTTDIAKQLQGEGQGLYNVGMPAYTQALGYASQILGGNQAAAQRAVGPTEQQIADTYAGQQKAIAAGPLRGGARDVAIAQAMQGQAQATGNLLPELQTQMFQAAGQMGLAGAQAGGQFQQSAAGLNAEVAQLYQQQDQFAIQAEQANRFGIGQLNVANEGLQIQQALGNAYVGLGQTGLNLQATGLNQQSQEFTLSQQQQQNQFNQMYNLSQEQQAWTQEFQNQQLQQQQQSATGSMVGSIVGAAAMAALMCFITTAVCDLQGKPDDCDELETLRKFRDGWLMDQPGGPELIARYKVIAPKILTALKERGILESTLHGVYIDYIDPAVRNIKVGEFEIARELYTEMVIGLLAMTGVEG